MVNFTNGILAIDFSNIDWTITNLYIYVIVSLIIFLPIARNYYSEKDTKVGESILLGLIIAFFWPPIIVMTIIYFLLLKPLCFLITIGNPKDK